MDVHGKEIVEKMLKALPPDGAPSLLSLFTTS